MIDTPLVRVRPRPRTLSVQHPTAFHVGVLVVLDDMELVEDVKSEAGEKEVLLDFVDEKDFWLLA